MVVYTTDNNDILAAAHRLMSRGEITIDQYAACLRRSRLVIDRPMMKPSKPPGQAMTDAHSNHAEDDTTPGAFFTALKECGVDYVN